MTGTELVPYVKPQEQIRPAWHEEWWQRLEDKWNPPFELPNIHFHYHHEDFFNRHISIRAARDWKNHPFWFYVACLFFLSFFALHGIGLSFKFFAPYVPYMPSGT